MPKQIKIPIITKEIIDYLDSLFPDKCAELDQTEKEVMYKSGQRSVVEHLLNKQSEQQEK